MTVAEKSGLTDPTTNLDVAHLINAIENEEFLGMARTLAQLAQRKGFEVLRYGDAYSMTDWVLGYDGWSLNNEPDYDFSYEAVKDGGEITSEPTSATFGSIDELVDFLVQQEDIPEDEDSPW